MKFLYCCLQLGYAVIDLEVLNQSEFDDPCLSRFIALVLQVCSFICSFIWEYITFSLCHLKFQLYFPKIFLKFR